MISISVSVSESICLPISVSACLCMCLYPSMCLSGCALQKQKHTRGQIAFYQGLGHDMFSFKNSTNSHCLLLLLISGVEYVVCVHVCTNLENCVCFLAGFCCCYCAYVCGCNLQLGHSCPAKMYENSNNTNTAN